MSRHLRVDEHELLDARRVFEREETRERAAGVLRNDAVALQLEALDEPLERVSLSREAEVGRVAPLRVAHARQVGHVARVAPGKLGQDLPPGETGQRKAVDEQ